MITVSDLKCVLVTGGAGGLGRAMAEELIKQGKKVLLAGRTESSLASTAKEIGAAGHYVLDTGKSDTIPSFLDTVLKDHPELDGLINNAGVQRPFQVLGPEYDFDLAKADQEIDINIRGPLHLSVHLIQRHFNNLPNGAIIMNVSSGLGFVPFSVINPVYNGTKAWVHSFSTNLRTQLERADSKVRIVEIAPPAVETDLHRERTDPDDNKKGKLPTSLSIEEYMADVKEGWEKNHDTIGPGMSKGLVETWEKTFGEKYREMAQ